ncbi:unnamed protein product [Prorocentrum cordatum]|uniref:Uncharacterized protein n=1 Tax=Prorocentrum cordatum TaxID=2364126 RepID=A0ABN9TNB8_9DINO|nr:unnamed protein product [Polarella glacialis]
MAGFRSLAATVPVLGTLLHRLSDSTSGDGDLVVEGNAAMRIKQALYLKQLALAMRWSSSELEFGGAAKDIRGWKRPIDDKVAFLNESGAVDVTFALLDNVSLLHVDFYNAASGRGGNFEIAVPDAEYLLAELLGIEQDLLVDHRGRPLPDARAARMHRERSYRAQFAEVLEELRRQTSEDGGALPLDELDAEDSAEDFEPRVAGQDHPQAGSHLPPLPVAVAVPCVVVGVVLLAALAPPLGRVRERAAALLGVGRRAPP